MIIKRYNCKRFAGIKDKDIHFQDGLNVILGSNEAGKSTLVEGIHSVLFKSSKIGNRSTEDKEFRGKFMPIPTGDSIDGELTISHIDGDYTLSREWGSNAFSQLTLPDLHILKNEESIQSVLKEVLIFGEGTYSSIFFSKQVHIKEAIQKIVGNKEATSEISSLLRRAIMELDGISLDKLSNLVDREIDLLYKKWDIEKSYPENNKGISNPYKVGIGQIVESFYKKETIRLEMDKANEAEKQFNEICEELKTVELNLIELKNKKESMEKLEEDIIKRSLEEPKIKNLESEIDLLAKVNQKWPQSEMRLKQLQEELSKLEGEYKNLEREKELAKQVVEKNVLEANRTKVDELKIKLNQIKEQISEIMVVTKEDVSNLDSYYNDMNRTQAMIEAGIIIGQINYYNGESNIIITKDLDSPVEVNIGEKFKANGYIKLELDNIFEIELKSGDIDFKQLRDQYEAYKNNLESLLKRLNVASIEDAKWNKEKLEEFNRTVETINNQIDSLLEEESYNSLKDKIDAYGDLSHIRSMDEIEREIKDIATRNTDVISDIKVVENEIDAWTDEYVNLDGLFDKIIDLKMSLKEIRTGLDKLAPLPEEYESAQEFRDILSKTRTDYELAQQTMQSLKETYYERERNLPASTFEEYSKDYIAQEHIFEKKLEKGKKLLKIKDAFEATRLKMDEASFKPVIEAFTKYISLLTNGNYKSTEIDNEFNVRLEKDNQTIMPLNLLSTGTYDSVALALRLSILEYILGENKGFLILDDCLVDLDPYRKEMAIKLINEFANKHQVIFTTCSPDTAGLLGGYLIEM